MKRVTKNNLIKLVKMKQEYQRTGEEQIRLKINEYIDNVINKDKRYYSKLLSYHLDVETIRYLV